MDTGCADLYGAMTPYYDAFVRDHRDYDAIAADLLDRLGDAERVLDIGIGTGLVVEHLLERRPTLDVTGVDVSPGLLEQARARLGDRVRLHRADICALDLDQRFDAAYSRGGAWTFVLDEGRPALASHILDPDAIDESFARVVAHLRPGGRLLISSSNAHAASQGLLDGDVRYHRRTTVRREPAGRLLVLDYTFRAPGRPPAHQRIEARLLDADQVERVVGKAGLTPIPGGDDRFMLFARSR